MEACPRNAPSSGASMDRFNEGYFRVQERYTQALRNVLHHRRPALIASIAIMSTAFVLLPFVGRDFFPSVDAGRSKLHIRARPGTRIETTKVIFSQVKIRSAPSFRRMRST